MRNSHQLSTNEINVLVVRGKPELLAWLWMQVGCSNYCYYLLQHQL